MVENILIKFMYVVALKELVLVKIDNQIYCYIYQQILKNNSKYCKICRFDTSCKRTSMLSMLTNHCLRV